MRCLLVAFLTIAVFLQSVRSQAGLYPLPTTVSLRKPTFASSSCGTTGAQNFCSYNSDPLASLAPNCITSVCNDTCPYSDTSPIPIDLITAGTLGDGVTLGTDGGPALSASNVLNFTNSYVSISSVPRINQNGFSFTAWIKQDPGNSGALLSKANADGTDRVYAISVTESTLTFNYHPSSLISVGYSSLMVDSLSLLSNAWHHIAVTVYENDFALYVNGTVQRATSLTSSIFESDDTVYLGQIAPDINHYNGLLQEAYFYLQALTEREVQELFAGELPFIWLNSDCHCPPSHPLADVINADRCTQHPGVNTGRGTVIRINSNSHTVGYVNDNIYSTSWVSGITEREVNLTMSLISGSQSAYELVFVFIYYGAPAPKAAVLEKSNDEGRSYQPFQYFADNCVEYFNLTDDQPLTTSTGVNCITTHSNSSLLTGDVARVRLLNPNVRPADYNTDSDFRNFLLFDHIKLRMLDYFTENRTSNHLYYNIEEILVAARCACNGHASSCSNDIHALCNCQHNTKGNRCDQCLDFYNDKPWREGTVNSAFPCKVCSCNNHAASCIYNASLDPFPDSYDNGGGGMCIGCDNYTTGQHCELCVDGFYRPIGYETTDANPCVSCNCSSSGSTSIICVKHEGIPGQVVGKCPCKPNVQGLMCDQCVNGYFNLSSSNPNGCESCNCNTDGTVGGSTTCDANTGQCSCKLNVEGLKCNQCKNGTRSLSDSNPDGCSACSCDVMGSLGSDCDANTGQCMCKPGVTGLDCNMCDVGHHSFSSTGCQSCDCSDIGSVASNCNMTSGICTCRPGFSGDNCDRCEVGFYNYTAGCLPCGCSISGTIQGLSNQCNTSTGQCSCKTNVEGRTCDSCITNYTNLQGSNENGCSPCDCTLENTNQSSVVTCDPVTSQCNCLPFASGLQCDVCSENYYSDPLNTCRPCTCNSEGSHNTSCSSITGQCFCISDKVNGTSCGTCLHGHYGFPSCIACQCNSSGSIESICNVTTGDCQCKAYVAGMNCDVCIEGFENLQAENPFGCSKAPANQSAPILLSKTSVSIQLSWTLPAEPNGVIESFNIYRNGSIISSVSQTVTTFNDTGLNPNTAYDYQIESVNIVGSSRSDSLIVTTSESVPERVNPPMLSVINATTILAQWMPPNDTNGIIIQYKVNLIAVDGVILDEPVMKFIGNTLSAVIGDLGTFTDNMFILEACTSVGCSSSSSVSITTAEDAPEFQLPPNVTALNSTSVEISWSSPSHPNGVIIRYEIYQRIGNTDGAGMIVKTVPSNVQYSVLNGLNPYTLYEFSITSYTSFGGTASTWTQERTLEDVPEDVPDPILTVLDASEVSITWQAPSTPNGIVIQYRVFLQYLDNGTVANVANFTQVGSYNVSGLIPYTLYSFFVTACTSVGCSSSQHVVERTLESEPQNVNPISFTYSDGNLQLIWDPPVSPNGIIMSYNITRESPSLLSSPLKRDLGTPYFGTSYASFPTSNAFAGLSVKMTLYFKTLMEDGILVYLISSSKTDMFAVELRNGRPWFIFDSGSGPGVLTVDDSLSFNDGEWHYLSAEKNRLQGTLTIDGIHMITGSSMGTAQNFGTPQVYYVGGLPDGASLTTVNSNYSLEGKTFGGCLYDVRFSDIKLNYSQQLNKNSGIGLPEWGCPINLGRGISFVGGGYQSTGAFSSPGISAFSMSILVKTTSSSGLVFFSYGRDSYIIIQLEGSSLVLKTKGEGSNENSLSAFSNTICDGQWHKIQIQKEEDGIILSLDGNTVILQFPGGSVNLTTNSISFIGGIPVDSNADRRYTQITSNRHVDFSGCVQNFTINDDLVNLRTDYIDQENVRMYGCEDDQSSSSCQQRITTFTIPNNSTSYTDSTTDYFTEYTYQVTAENSAGAGYSDWIRVISQSSAPQGTSLISFVNTTSTSLQMTWERPSLPNGIITQYEITTTPINNLFRKRREATLPVTTTIPIERPGQPLTTTIEGLSPATNYSVVLTASTAAASGHVSTVYVVTPEDIPGGVQMPLLVSRTHNSFEFTILPPLQPNGAIIIYKLYIDDLVLMTTNQSIIVSSLSPVTQYDYYLEACTAVGCANSSVGTNVTLGDQPTDLNPPTLTDLSPTTIMVTWEPPSQPNGPILYYELVQIADSTEIVIYNDTNRQTTISGLAPNTLYFYKVIAYNSFGSVSSNVSVILTPEGTPDQILPPNITIINSSAIYVEWQEPLSPNGVIVNYTLLQNDVAVITSLMFSHTAVNLEPFTVYSFSVQACTLQGCSKSTSSVGQTDEAIPEGYITPTIVTSTSQSITLTIHEVQKPNGNAVYYLTITGEFLLNTTLEGRLTVTEKHTVYNNSITGAEPTVTIASLIPFAVYTFEMHISTSAGSLGDQFNVSTPSAAPELQSPPQLSLAAATTILIQWEPPTYPNGLITSYSLSVEPPLSSLYQLTYSGNESSAILDNLTPFTNYTVSISSFNDAGSATSHPSLIMTSETAPDGFEQAIILSKTSYSLYVTWDPPSTPNGVIINYTVIINNEPTVTLDIDRLTYNVSSLKPYTSYNISVIACNNADCVSSPYITDVTNQAVPLNVSGPDLFATTSGPVIITWTEPDEPNGIIRNYTIYKSNTDDPFTLLTTVMATNNLRYNDSNVQPFTSYEYYIEATNDAGSTSGPSHTVTTSEAAPQGVNAPLLTAVSSTSIMLTIHPPDIPNGVIIEYVIHRTVHPQLHHTIYVSDPSHVNVTYLDDSLSPYTYYCYYIEACTGISCTSGPLGCMYTLEALPGDISAPIASGPKADVNLIINWEAPAMPNGIILNYTLIQYDLGFTSVSRHNCCVEYIRDEDDLSDDCVVIFMTPNPDDSYIDGSLDYYTYYEYCVVANNMIGSVASPQSSPIRTGIAPRPIAGPNITAIPLNSTAIFISWAPLGVEVLLGPFDGYTLYYNGTDNLNGNITLHVEDYILSGLTPNTLYSIKVSASNSVGSTDGNTVIVITLDGTPTGVLTPVVLPVSSDSLLITFDEPLQPNGHIVNYSIILDSVVVHNQSMSGNYLVTGLNPYTSYTVQLEVCTQYGCAKSGHSSNTTLQAAPEGFASPNVIVISPYEVTITWMVPSHPNGIITEYQIHMRTPVSCPIETDGPCYNSTLVSSGITTLTYTIEDLTPATDYSFAVIVINGGGSTSSGFTTNTTFQAPPSFISPPVLNVLTSTSIRVQWEVPTEPNGDIIAYNLYRNDTLVLGPTLSLSTTSISLQPFTVYVYIIESCTAAGCTNSSESIDRTLEAQPAGFDTPVISNITSTSLLISWTPPVNPNSFHIYYVVYFINDTVIANMTLINSASVNQLRPFTNYSFYVSACNGAGCVSSQSLNVMTNEALPGAVIITSVRALSFEETEISWDPPAQPNGIILHYNLYRDNVNIYQNDSLHFTDTNLVGGVTYVYYVEAVNSIGSTASNVFSFTTPTHSPTGISPPVTYIINSTAIQVIWTEPLKANGNISSYNLYLNNSLRFTGLSFGYTLTNLLPYTIYAIHIEICTTQGDCGGSSTVLNTTSQDNPAGVIRPVLMALSSTTVSVSWQIPQMPNGVISFYRVRRRLAQMPSSTIFVHNDGPGVFSFTDQDLSPYTAYEYQLLVVNGAGSTSSDWVAVTTLEGSPVGLSLPTFPGIFSNNITVSWSEPLQANGIILQYQVFYRRILGTLMMGSTVSGNVTEAVVTGLTPFTIYEVKIRVSNSAGNTDSDFGVVTTSEAVPGPPGLLMLGAKTSESLTLSWSAPAVPNGHILEYVIYLDGNEEQRLSANTYTIIRLNPFTSYLVQLEVCNSAGCTRGQVQAFTTSESLPTGQPSPTVVAITSRIVQIQWVPPTQPNGIITSYMIYRMEVLDLNQMNNTEGAVLLYQTTNVAMRAYNDTIVRPDVGYQYSIRAVNSIGLVMSDFTYVQTPEDAPELLDTPTVSTLTAYDMRISWDEPSMPNGDVISYEVFRISPDNIITSQHVGPGRSFTDGGLRPYSLYSYFIRVCTAGGCTNSSSAGNTTDEAIPEGFASPNLIPLSNTEISIHWDEPATPNGIITTYIVNVTSPVIIPIPTTELSLNITNLQSFTYYTVVVSACTVAGCAKTTPLSVRTLESLPMLLSPPTVVSLSPTSLMVSWTPPAQPNGIIIRYILRRNGTTIFDGLNMTYTDINLLPNQAYSYDIQAFTSVGSGDRSSLILFMTDSDTPTDVYAPVIPLPSITSSSALVIWQFPGTPNGVIRLYRLFRRSASVEVELYNGSALSAIVRELIPYTVYSFRIEACTTTCGTSSYTDIRTLEDVPEGLAPPILHPYPNHTVLVTWSPPSSPNGLLTFYSLQRRQVILEGLYSTVSDVNNSISPFHLQYLDEDSLLTPTYTYQYRISVANGVGGVTSDYSSVTLLQDIPEGVSDPVLVEKTSTTLTVSVSPPATPNGVITGYHLHVVSGLSQQVVPSSQSAPAIFTVMDLSPYTSYTLYAETCTSIGCDSSANVTMVTAEAPPIGLLPPVASVTGSRSMRLTWVPPSQPNGIITSYSIWYKLPCPQPITHDNQPSCIETDLILSTSLLSLSYEFTSDGSTHPYPYSSYQFLLGVSNSAGSVNSTPSDVVTTLPDVPEIVNVVSYTIFESNRSIVVNWGRTFQLNGVLLHYIVIRNGVFLYQGPQTYRVFGNQPIETELQYSVRVVTESGEVTTPTSPLFISGLITSVSSSSSSSSGSAVIPSPSVSVTDPPMTDEPFYTQPPFVIGMIFLVLLILFVILLVLLCLVRPGRKKKKTKDNYDVSTLKSQGGSPAREDGTVRASWGPPDEKITPVPSYHEAMVQSGFISTSGRSKSYSPSKVALLNEDFYEGDIPLQDTHITRLSKIDMIPESVLGPPPLPLTDDVPPGSIDVPTVVPIEVPVIVPSSVPSIVPASIPSGVPSGVPSIVPSGVPSIVPVDIEPVEASQAVPSLNVETYSLDSSNSSNSSHSGSLSPLKIIIDDDAFVMDTKI